jgi:hypothetical protein
MDKHGFRYTDEESCRDLVLRLLSERPWSAVKKQTLANEISALIPTVVNDPEKWTWWAELESYENGAYLILHAAKGAQKKTWPRFSLTL